MIHVFEALKVSLAGWCCENVNSDAIGGNWKWAVCLISVHERGNGDDHAKLLQVSDVPGETFARRALADMASVICRAITSPVEPSIAYSDFSVPTINSPSSVDW